MTRMTRDDANERSAMFATIKPYAFATKVGVRACFVRGRSRTSFADSPSVNRRMFRRGSSMTDGCRVCACVDVYPGCDDAVECVDDERGGVRPDGFFEWRIRLRRASTRQVIRGVG